MPPSRSRRRDDYDDRPRRRQKRRGSNTGLIVVIILAIGIPALTGVGYLIYRITKSDSNTDKQAATSELDAYRKKLIGRWQIDSVSNGRKQTIIVEYKDNGTSAATGTLDTGQQVSLTGKWEALRVEGKSLIIRSSTDRDPQSSSEVTYAFSNDNEFIQSTPGGRTLTARRIK